VGVVKVQVKVVYQTHKRVFLGLASFLSVSIVWEVLGRLGMINPLFFSWPSPIIKALYEIIIEGELLYHLSVSFFELLSGYSLAFLAIPLGLLMGRSKTIEYLLDPIISALNAVPRIALMPLIILLFGIGSMSKIVIVFLGCFFPILVNVFQGTKNIDQLTIDMARVFGAKDIRLVWHVFVPSILPYMMAGFRIALSIGLIMVVVSEFLVGSAGIGYMIAYEASFYNASGLLAWVLIISVLSIILSEILKFWEKRTSWK
jgi:NitT/TauT family transport system permease protein